MSAQVRQATATPGSSNCRSNTPAMPAYQSPTFPLNADGQRAMGNLLRKRNIDKLNEDITGAQDELTSTGVALHDKLREHEGRLESRRRKQNQGAHSQHFAEFEKRVKEMREKVDGMVARMEKEMRGLIDCKASTASMQDAVRAAEAEARANAGTQASTQHTQTQRDLRTRRNRAEDASDPEEDEGEDVEQQWEPTDPAGGSQHAPTETFDRHVEQTRDSYQGLSLYDRYAKNQSYAEFRKMLHDAQYPDEQPPDPSHWFNEPGAPAPGTQRILAGTEDSDEDVAVVRGQISTKCPLTLQELKEPLTSTKCRHIFESYAILQFIAQSKTNPKAVQCPVPGCMVMLEKRDVRPDKLTIQRIQRIQRSKQQQEAGEDSEDEIGGGTQGRSHVIDDEDDDDAATTVETAAAAQPHRRLKSEPRPSGTGS